MLLKLQNLNYAAMDKFCTFYNFIHPILVFEYKADIVFLDLEISGKLSTTIVAQYASWKQ